MNNNAGAPKDDKNKKGSPLFGGGPVLPNFKLPDNWKAIALYAAALFIGMSFFSNNAQSAGPQTVDFSDFRARVYSGEIRRVEMSENYFTGFTRAERPAAPRGGLMRFRAAPADQGPVFRTVAIPNPDFIRLMDDLGVAYSAVSRQRGVLFGFLLSWILPVAFFILVWRFLLRRMGNMGGGVLSAGQSRAVVVAEGDIVTRFNDVAGVDEAKEELVEVVDFLKNPDKYSEIGGKIPKGVLLVGPPGTGKTLLARAMAGEAEVSFLRMSGADFVEMFVGVGAARVRDLFKQARSKAPCIIFIDELDAIGKSRMNNAAGGNDEREQTLNQLLVEMDGFDGASGIIILAATNRPDVLDPALLRPGRFDRQVLVDRPDLKGREAILRIHSKPVKLDPALDIGAVARVTSGFSGADLANIVNEAALLAVRAGRKMAAQRDFDEAIEKTVAGLQKKTRVLKPKERKLTAYHEAGHAIIAAFTPGADPVQKISIIPRGFALGYTLQLPLEDRYTVTESDLLGRIDILLGGRIAEEMVSGEFSTGAASDLTKATDIARKMIADYGMSGRFRHVALTTRGAGGGGRQQEPSFQREYAESTQQYIDEEIARIIETRYAKAKKTLEDRRDVLDIVSGALLEKETLDEAEFKALLAEYQGRITSL